MVFLWYELCLPSWFSHGPLSPGQAFDDDPETYFWAVSPQVVCQKWWVDYDFMTRMEYHVGKTTS